ncbi:hypothetical protein FA15DRAFT_671850 [Coprinopsis marcescibilis]|uniref:Uncharacterized protein n=1 Tax=Coprinopsis marcescibilis TaxID=230819 RepID=A0A5C3KNT5_COPMA|nr:hypothetical protein FA15DRAFT_671850 [Coprinopsis marcescibilis]
MARPHPLHLALLSAAGILLLPVTLGQDVVTLYRQAGPVSIIGTVGPGLAVELADPGKVVGVTPLAVDADGYTQYAIVEAQSVLVSAGNLEVTTVTLATPTTQTYTFHADASRVRYSHTTQFPEDQGGENVSVNTECTHGVDGDTRVEDGSMVCVGKLTVEGSRNGSPTTAHFTQTFEAKVAPLATLRNPQIGQPAAVDVASGRSGAMSSQLMGVMGLTGVPGLILSAGILAWGSM